MRIHRTIALSIIALAGGATAHAADWAGPYVGANIGFGGGTWQASESGLFSIPAVVGPPTQTSLMQGLDVSGAVGGLQGGYSWRFGAVVLGGEADADLAGITGDAIATQNQRSLSSPPPAFAFGATQPVKATADWLVTLRARVGWSQDDFLFYGTAGLAGAHLSYQSAAFGGLPSATTSQVEWGGAFGAGIEYAATAAISLRVEYLYVRLSDYSASYTLRSGAGGSPYTNTVGIADPSLNIVRVGMNWHF